LYEANTSLSQAFYGPYRVWRLALGIRCNELLAEGLQRSDWYAVPVFEESETVKLKEAQARLEESGKGITPGSDGSHSIFGFWIGLTTAKYSRRLWTPCLSKAFPAKKMNNQDVQTP